MGSPRRKSESELQGLYSTSPDVFLGKLIDLAWLMYIWDARRILASTSVMGVQGMDVMDVIGLGSKLVRFLFA